MAGLTLQDPYRVLGVDRDADLEQIKAAHRRLAKRYHPDASGGEEERFLAVQAAYQLLADPLRRREWDRRHAPGPVRAQGSPGKRPSRASAQGDGRARGPRYRNVARSPRRQPRDGRTRGYTWSAAGVPWWEDFRPKGASNADRASARRPSGEAEAARGTEAEAEAARAERPPGEAEAAKGPGRRTRRTRRAAVDPAAADPESRPNDFDVFSRSSGAAWSQAARRHFRRGDAELPSRGAWRYRGTQVVTGAEARKVAAQEAAREAAADRARAAADRAAADREAADREAADRARERQRQANQEALFRQRGRGPVTDRQPFHHGSRGPDEMAQPGPRPRPSRRVSISDALAGYLRARRDARKAEPSDR